MLAFPMYAQLFYPNTDNQTILSAGSIIQKTVFTISGMTCSGCEEHVNHEVNKLTGILNTTVSYKNGNAIVEFDQSKTDIEEIERAITKTGYSVTGKKEIK